MISIPKIEKIRPPAAVLLIAAAAFAAYGGTLAGSFVYDDHKVVAENLMIRDWKNAVHLFDASYFRRAGELSYRPAVTLSYFLDYTFWRLRPAGYHLTGVLAHASCAALLYICLRRVLKRNGAPLAAGLFFAVHPAVSEAVSCVGFREDILAALFSLAALLSYLKIPGRRRRSAGYYAGCWAAFALALFSKECALILPLIFLLYEFSFSGVFLKSVKEKAPLYAGLLVIAAFYVAVRFFILTHSEEIIFYPPPFYHRMLTTARTFFFYLRQLVFPLTLSAEYKYPVSRSLFEPAAALSAAGIVLILAAWAIAARRGREYFFAAGWFFFSLLPVANVVPLYNPVAERYLYFPAMGFCLFFSLAAESVIGRLRLRARGFAAALLLLALFLYGARTAVRSRDWKDHFTFLKKTIATCPESAKFRSNLGYMYEQKDMLEEAEKELLIALKLDPDYDSAHHNLGLVYRKKGMLAEAEAEFRTALKINPGMAGAHHNLGLLYGMRGRIDEAMEEFRAALKKDPDFAKSHFNLAFCYQSKGLLDEAIAEYRTAVRLDPGDAKNHFYLGTAYETKGETGKAVEKYEAAIKIDPGHVKSYIKLGEIYSSKGDYAKAGEYREKALKMDPSIDGLKPGPGNR